MTRAFFFLPPQTKLGMAYQPFASGIYAVRGFVNLFIYFIIYFSQANAVFCDKLNIYPSYFCVDPVTAEDKLGAGSNNAIWKLKCDNTIRISTSSKFYQFSKDP